MDHLFKSSVLQLHGYTSPPQQHVKAKLNQNESPFDVPEALKKALVLEAARLSWNRYPENESTVLKEKLAAWHAVEPEQILFGNGSNQLLQTLMIATVEEGGKMLYFPPTFSLFDLYGQIFEADLIEIYQPPGEPFPWEKAIETIHVKRPHLTLVCSPNNPTGSEVELENIEEICQAANGLVFVDEAYGEFSERTAIPLIKKYPQLIVSRTFSKAFSLAGLRFGYFIAQKEIIAELRKVNLPYNVNIFTELVASSLLDNQEIMKEHVHYLVEERDFLYQKLLELKGVAPYYSRANFILFKIPSSRKIISDLQKMGILVRDVGSYPLLNDHIRVTVGTRDENDLFLQALRNLVN